MTSMKSMNFKVIWTTIMNYLFGCWKNRSIKYNEEIRILIIKNTETDNETDRETDYSEVSVYSESSSDLEFDSEFV